ncbi:hypothetical protein LCGC14_0721140 [marine sediment metagenome]|uniref:Glycosyltransferase 2-like domain-containing protein n=1 Tax=marine sediment metagenome TaxID=412755 RepID=A0A0F9QGH6_9ZZZZ
MSIVAIIPCHNEAKYIGKIVREVRQHVDAVVVVDDASTDDTFRVAKMAGAHVALAGVAGPVGQGRATMVGLNAVKERYPEATMIVTLDGDGQHNPEEIPRLLEPIWSGRADIVIGSRFLEDYKIARYRKFGIDVITWLYNVGSGRKIVDGQSCFRAFHVMVFEFIHAVEDGFTFSTEVLIRARSRGLRIVEVPISCIYHDKLSENSTKNPITHGLGVALGTLKWRFWEVRQ